jgi:hypothetical protein
MKNRGGYRPEEKIAGGDVSLDERKRCTENILSSRFKAGTG